MNTTAIACLASATIAAAGAWATAPLPRYPCQHAVFGCAVDRAQ